mmetsp:Transcript_17658/g.28758  ORF Transcript_17658/g.28758 Transcript_17658/m.28758 type:complete len:543 (+) Transcript_17658:121-1749(+)
MFRHLRRCVLRVPSKKRALRRGAPTAKSFITPILPSRSYFSTWCRRIPEKSFPRESSPAATSFLNRKLDLGPFEETDDHQRRSRHRRNHDNIIETFRRVSLQNSATPLAKLLVDFMDDNRSDLSFINISALLMNYAKLRKTKVGGSPYRGGGDDFLPAIGPKTARFLAEQIHKMPTEDVNEWALGNTLYGIQAVVAHSPEMRRLTEALVPKIWGCEEQMKPSSISNALFGLRFLDDCSAADRAMEALTVQIEDCPSAFSGHALGICMLSLRHRPDSVVSRRCIRALAQRVGECASFSPIDISKSVVGVRGKGRAPASHYLVSELAERLPHVDQPFSSQAIAWTLFSLKDLEDTTAAEDFLRNFSRCVRDNLKDNTAEEFTKKSISLSFAGLRTFSCKPSCEILSYLLPKLDEKEAYGYYDVSSIVTAVHSADRNTKRILPKLINPHLQRINKEIDLKLVLKLLPILVSDTTSSHSIQLSHIIASRISALHKELRSENVKNIIRLIAGVPSEDATLQEAPLRALAAVINRLTSYDTMECINEL